MRKMLGILSALLAMSAATPCMAVTVDFSFTDGTGTVTGEIDGLTAGTANSPFIIIVNSAPPQFLVSPTPAQFFATDSTHDTIVLDGAGDVVSYDLFAEYQIYATLNLSSSCLSCSSLSSDTGGGGTVTVTANALPIPTVGGAPIPASFTLFATVLGCLAFAAYVRGGAVRPSMQRG